MTMATETKVDAAIWIISNGGDHRLVWGPFRSAEAAKREAGKVYFVATTERRDALRNGQPLRVSELRVMVRSGTIRLPEGMSFDAI